VLLLASSLSAQKTADKKVIGYFSRKSSGHWIDTSDSKNPRRMVPLAEIYASSRLEREAPKSETDKLWVSLPNGDYPKPPFDCSQPTVCERPLDLKRIETAARPQFATFARYTSMLGGQTRSGRSVMTNPLMDTAIAAGAQLRADRIFTKSAPGKEYSLAWCSQVSTRNCPDDPVPISVNWDPLDPNAVIPTTDIVPGLHRLRLLNRRAWGWAYDDDYDAYVLVIGGNDADAHVARVAASLASLREELGEHLADYRARILTLLDLAATSPR
jgi:hypothetical protein